MRFNLPLLVLASATSVRSIFLPIAVSIANADAYADAYADAAVQQRENCRTAEHENDHGDGHDHDRTVCIDEVQFSNEHDDEHDLKEYEYSNPQEHNHGHAHEQSQDPPVLQDQDVQEPHVYCGHQRAERVYSCKECPTAAASTSTSSNGNDSNEKRRVPVSASGCAGDCRWDKSRRACVSDNGNPDINCGDHDAAVCGDCQAYSSNPSACAGDCEWDHSVGSCVPSDKIQKLRERQCPEEQGQGQGQEEEGDLDPDPDPDPEDSDADTDTDAFADLKGPGDSDSNSNPEDSDEEREGEEGQEEYDEAGLDPEPDPDPEDSDANADADNDNNLKDPDSDSNANSDHDHDHDPDPKDSDPVAVNCGTHEADTCAECPQVHEDGEGEGKGSHEASGCAGECMWDNWKKICIPDRDRDFDPDSGGGGFGGARSDVNCGDHDAISCGDCRAGDSDTTGCSGDCQWDHGVGSCVPSDKIHEVVSSSSSCQQQCPDLADLIPHPFVNCGTHEADNCAECPLMHAEGEGQKGDNGNGNAASGCAGECMWDKWNKICVPDPDPSDGNVTDVNCGDHDAISCGECPYADGENNNTNNAASGCAGECMWDNWNNICIPDPDPSEGNGSDVNCGDHDAISCGDCRAGVADTTGCSGDCRWSDIFGSCVNVKPPIDNFNCVERCLEPELELELEEPEPGNEKDRPEPPYADRTTNTAMVNCGGQEAPNCNMCVKEKMHSDSPAGAGAGVSPQGCGGECMWDKESQKCIEDKGISNVNCGDHDAVSCDKCQATADDPSGCSGDCKWMESDDDNGGGGGSCRIYSHDDFDSPHPMVDCGDHKAPHCGECPTGTDGAADGCAGDCLWNAIIRKCLERDPNGSAGVDCGSHRAGSCDDCANGEEDGCQGDCTWFAASHSCILGDVNVSPINCGKGRNALSCSQCVREKNKPAGCSGQCVWDKSKSSCVDRPPNSPISQCGDHQATTCGQCGHFPKNTRLSGQYYTNTYNPDKHEILDASHPPVGPNGRIDLRKMRGDLHVPRGEVSIQVYTTPDADGALMERIGNHTIQNAVFRKKYCSSAHTKYPAQVQVAAPGFRRRQWFPGYVVVLSPLEFVFILTDNRMQMPFTRATEAQKKKWITGVDQQ